MADNKKYYYMRLKENFFDSDEMIILENMDNGDGIIYSNILLKLYLRSLKYEGRLMFNERIPFNPQMLSTIGHGNLRRSWNAGKIERSGSNLMVEIYNDAEYAIYVEKGHRQQVGRYVPVLGKRLKNGWVEGVHIPFVKTAVENVIKEALLSDDRIDDVTIDSVEQTDRHMVKVVIISWVQSVLDLGLQEPQQQRIMQRPQRTKILVEMGHTTTCHHSKQHISGYVQHKF